MAILVDGKRVARLRKRYYDNAVGVLRENLRSLESMMFNINHTRLSDGDLRISSVSLNDDKEYIVVISNRTLGTLSDSDRRRVKGSSLLELTDVSENNGLLYMTYHLPLPELYENKEG